MLEAVQEREDDAVGDGLRLDPLERVLEIGALTVTSRSDTGCTRRSVTSGRAVTTSAPAASSAIPANAISWTLAGCPTQMCGSARLDKARGESAADGARPEDCDLRAHAGPDPR